VNPFSFLRTVSCQSNWPTSNHLLLCPKKTPNCNPIDLELAASTCKKNSLNSESLIKVWFNYLPSAHTACATFVTTANPFPLKPVTHPPRLSLGDTYSDWWIIVYLRCKKCKLKNLTWWESAWGTRKASRPIWRISVWSNCRRLRLSTLKPNCILQEEFILWNLKRQSGQCFVVRRQSSWQRKRLFIWFHCFSCYVK